MQTEMDNTQHVAQTQPTISAHVVFNGTVLTSALPFALPFMPSETLGVIITVHFGPTLLEYIRQSTLPLPALEMEILRRIRSTLATDQQLRAHKIAHQDLTASNVSSDGSAVIDWATCAYADHKNPDLAMHPVFYPWFRQTTDMDSIFSLVESIYHGAHRVRKSPLIGALRVYLFGRGFPACDGCACYMRWYRCGRSFPRDVTHQSAIAQIERMLRAFDWTCTQVAY
jgi:hypothetical protein